MALPCEVTVWADAICEPFICHSTNAPVLLCCHRMAALPLLLKLPTSTMLHVESGVTGLPPEGTVALAEIAEPFISHVASDPVVLCRHSTSAAPSPLKSPMPPTLQEESGVIGLPCEATKF